MTKLGIDVIVLAKDSTPFGANGTLVGTIRTTRNDGGTAQRISLSVSAELIGDPVDIPVDFDAEVDLGAGKLRMSKLRVQT